MGKLPKYTLVHNENTQRWDLKKDKSNEVVKKFDTKQEATKGGVLQKAIGGVGSVKIQKVNGEFEAERTYPRGADPKTSKG